MIKIVKVAAVALLLAVTSYTAKAQTNSYRTNVLLNITVNLTAYEQVYLFISTNGFPATNGFLSTNGFWVPSAKTAKVVTSGVIKSIAHQIQLPGDLSTAKLYWRLSWTDPNDISHDVILRTATLETNVNNYMLISFPDSVTTQRATLTGTTNAIDYANCNVSVGTSQGSFTLHGIATIKSASLVNKGQLIDPNPFPQSFSATVAGSGSVAFHQAEWKGTVMGSGQKIEIEPVSP